MSELSIEQYKLDQHVQAVQACFDCATRGGLSKEQARECSRQHSHNCTGCPHRPVLVQHQAC